MFYKDNIQKKIIFNYQIKLFNINYLNKKINIKFKII